ncbi:hypothetical protein Tsubulata_047728 [Turnera subulata]|uniref:CCT domain-containing protein n=1 Tax=Turnera subulata TaxID=218843 RepID=A0A9Q0FLU6_9ROSI|nr:hypothetical protein Tsubulata_047728 [Turnera subulata]
MYHSSNSDFHLLGNDHHHSPASSPPELPFQSPLQLAQYLIVDPDHQLTPASTCMEIMGGGHSSSTNSTTGGYGSPSSMAATCSGATHQRRPSLMQRSISSHSLQKNNGYHCHFTSARDFLDMDSSPVRRVSSTGDLQHGYHGHSRADSPLSSESSVIIESMTRASKYSPEEKKERIERYRSKRNQRNFNKKIKYACRKTLADSRPRIRGRFARNDEIPQLQWCNNISGEEEEEDDDENWINFLDAFSANSIP